MRVFITGISGFIGAEVARVMVVRGHDVRGSSTSANATLPWRTVTLRLGDRVNAAWFEGVDAVIHTAHDLKPRSRARNVAGTRAVADAAAAAGVARQVYVSSYSAHAGAVTEYGQTKRELEPFFLDAGHAVVRPGLVIGRGGLYARLAAAVRERRVVPVVWPAARVPVVAAADLAESLVSIAGARDVRVARLYLDERITMGELIRGVHRAVRSRATLIDVPYWLAMLGVVAVRAIGMDAPVDSNTLRALRANQGMNEPGDLRHFVPAPRSFDAMLLDAG